MNKQIAAVITLAGVIGTGTIAHAQSPAPSGVGGSPTPETVQAKLNALQQEIVGLKRDQVAMQHQQAVADKAAVRVESGGWYLKNEKDSVFPELVSDDGKSWVAIEGRLQVDTAINQPPYKGDSSPGGTRVNSAFRRIRLELKGQYDQYWIWDFEYDFTGSTTNSGIENAYAGWHGKIGDVYNIFLLGNQHVPGGLQTPSNYRTWMELPLATDTFVPARELGVTAQSSQKHWNLWYGAFNGVNPAGSSKPVGEPGTFTASGDFVINLINEPGRLIRIGNTLIYQEFGPTGLSYSTFPDSKEFGGNLVATPELLGTRSDLTYSPNIALQYGPLTFHTSYYFVHATGEAAGLSKTNELQGEASFSGWDVQAEYLLTGDVRPYSTEAGNFVGLKPLHPVTDGGWGAWQIKGRVDSVDLNDRRHDVEGGRETNLEAGLNWYPTAFTRVDLEYIKVLKVDGGPYSGDSPSILQGRLQFVF